MFFKEPLTEWFLWFLSSRWILYTGGGRGDSPFCVKRFENPEKRYINVTNYYYYYGTKNGSSMASLEEPFEAPLFLRGQELWDTSQILTQNSDFFLWFVSLYLAILILQFWLFSHSYMNWGVFTFSQNSEFSFMTFILQLRIYLSQIVFLRIAHFSQ